MAKKKKVENRGGAREGAGRKPIGDKAKVAMCIKIEPELRRYLQGLPNATAAIELAIKRSKAFKDWKKTFKKF